MALKWTNFAIFIVLLSSTPVSAQVSSLRKDLPREVNTTDSVLVPGTDGRQYLITASPSKPDRLIAIPLADARRSEDKDASPFATRGAFSRSEPREAPLIDARGKIRSLKEFSNRPHIVVLIQGAFCQHCMSQLAEFAKRPDLTRSSVVVLTPVNDLEELSDLPFVVLADTQHAYFRKFGAYRQGPLHATIVFGSRGNIVLKHVGEEPYTDFDAVAAALESPDK